ncbi:MAG TPA: gamma-glutamyltransferase family protein [Trueperaceae bacterium]
MNFDLPYPSKRAPVLARNLVATSQPLAAQAGLAMLQAGGNAVDAALASAITLTVVEPTGNGIGSDAFAIVWDGKRLHGLNASGRSPAAWSPDRFSDVGIPQRGWESVTVPGAVSAWKALSDRFGSLEFDRLFEPAIHYAEEGFAVTPHVAFLWNLAAEKLGGFEEFRRGFLLAGRAPRAGETFRYPDQALTLEAIAGSGGEAFYRGELAERIAADAERHGAALRPDDLAAHRPEWSGTISTSYRDLHLHEIPPNGQGLAALLALGILRHCPIEEYPIDSADSLHLQIEAMKLAFADAHRYVADPDHLDLRPSELLADEYLQGRAALIDRRRARVPSYGVPARSGTVYLSAADASGMMVSFIQSNYRGFGSGIVVPGTGISLQNRGAGFTLEEGHPNRVGGCKRPFHTIIPGFLMHGSKPLMSFGVMGGPMQPQGHLQMVLRVGINDQNPQAAVDAPRWQVMGGADVAVEPGFERKVLDELASRGHRLRQAPAEESFAFGGAQLIYRLEDGYVAGSEWRKDGQAVGF